MRRPVDLTKHYPDDYVRLCAQSPVPEWALATRRRERHGHDTLPWWLTPSEIEDLDMNEPSVFPALIADFR